MDKGFISEFMSKMQVDSDAFYNFTAAVRGGKNKVAHRITDEAVTLEEEWIDQVFGCLFSLEKIVKDPRKFIKENDVVVDVSKARKTTSRTVQHLASHSMNVSHIEDDGSVMPRKVLTIEREEDIGIYENRFIATLIKRLVTFIESRYNDIKGRMRVYEITNVDMDSSFVYGKSEISYRLAMTVKNPPKNMVLLEHNDKLLERIRQLRKRIKVLLNTDFYKTVSSLKPVLPPIMKTNLLTKNVEYRNCYNLWLYISAYTFVGYSIEIKEKTLPVDSDYFDDMTVLAALSMKTLIEDNIITRERYIGIPFKPPREKKYTAFTDYEYEPAFRLDKKEAGEDVVNEYYFTKMKEAFKKAAMRPTKNAVKNDVELTLSFSQFVRTVNRISNAMFYDVMKVDREPRSTGKKLTTLAKKQRAYKEQQTRYKRFQQLSRLKEEELQRTLAAESKELVKLETLREELDKAKERAVSKKAAEKRKKARLEKIRERAEAVQMKAQKHENELFAKEEERQRLREEKQRLRAEERKRKREEEKARLLAEAAEDYETDFASEVSSATEMPSAETPIADSVAPEIATALQTPDAETSDSKKPASTDSDDE